MTFRYLLSLLFVSMALGHMQMSFPPPFRSNFNPLAVKGNNDAGSMTTPISAAQFPCKGFQSDLGTPAGAPVVTWTQGSNVNFTLAGSAVHGGGSCQASLSMDAGKSWYVVKTYQGGCPLAAGSFDLTIPLDTPTGPALFGWTWYNHIGNREIYMNCASITIATGSGGPAPKTAFTSRPDMYVANLNNGCTTVEGVDTLIPNPGPDVDVVTTGGKSGPATGTCAPVNGIGGRTSGSSNTSPNTASSSVAPVASSSAVSIIPVSSATASGFITTTSPQAAGTSDPTTTISAPLSTGTSGTTSGLTPSKDGQCSGSQTCAGQSNFGSCCSKWGYCGNTDAHCGDGCMSVFGSCGVNGTATADHYALTSGARRARHVRHFKV